MCFQMNVCPAGGGVMRGADKETGVRGVKTTSEYQIEIEKPGQPEEVMLESGSTGGFDV